jgi:hypothetical protein
MEGNQLLSGVFFVKEHTGTLFRKFFLRGMQAEMAFWTSISWHRYNKHLPLSD